MKLAALLFVLVLSLAACGSDRSMSADRDGSTDPEDPPANQPSLRGGYECGSGTGDDLPLGSLAGTAIAVDIPGGLRIVEPVDGSLTDLPGFSFHSWSPDGSLLAARRDQEIAVFDRTLTSPVAVLPAADASWSPDSRRIGYFINPKFHIVDLETQDVTSAPVCPDLTRVPISGCGGAEWSRNMDWILVNYGAGYTRRSLLSRPDGTDASKYQGGDWSPDGRYFVLDAGGDYDWNFRVLDVESRSEIRYQAVIAESAPAAYRSTWEGVCHLTQYRDAWPGGPSRITWNVCEGAADVPPPPNRGLRRAAWNADGQWTAYFTSPDSTGHQELVVYDALTESSRSLCDVVFDDADELTFEIASLAWSADSRFFVATVTDTMDGIDKLALFSRDEAGMRWLGEAVGEGHWAPEERE